MDITPRSVGTALVIGEPALPNSTTAGRTAIANWGTVSVERWGSPPPRTLSDKIDKLVAENIGDRPVSDKVWKRLRRAAKKYLREQEERAKRIALAIDPAEVAFDDDTD